MSRQECTETSQDLMRFIAASPTAAHAVAEAARRLNAAGFKPLDERDRWQLEPGDSFYVVRGLTGLIAGRVGSKPAAEAGYRIAGAHTDAPGFRLKPHPAYSNVGYLQLGIEVYGGPLLASWTDRDLTLAGRLLVRAADGPPRSRLVALDRPVCRIPQLAIHFNREVNDKGLAFDKQKHLPPICGLGGEDELAGKPLLTALASAAAVDPADVLAMDIEVVDTQPPVLGGFEEELLFAPRIDNNAGCHAVLAALVHAERDLPQTQVVALFDSEEVGSQTLAGAGSGFLDAVLERLCGADRESYHRALAHSLLASVDGAHAVHPSFADFHDPRHQPRLNGGPVIKVNALGRYATDAAGRHWFEHCAEQARVPVQLYVHRTDLPCGSTIGPMTSTRLGVPTVDVGSPMLAMHSVRETGGADDQHHMIKALGRHFCAGR